MKKFHFLAQKIQQKVEFSYFLLLYISCSAGERISSSTVSLFRLTTQSAAVQFTTAFDNSIQNARISMQT